MLQKTAWGLAAGSLFLFFASVAQAATLAVSPASTSTTVGNTFSVNILLDTQSQAAYGVDVYSLHFNPTLLQVVSASTSSLQIAPGTLMSNTVYNVASNAAGTVQFSQTPTVSGSNFTGSGVLATVTFRAIAAGTSNLTFDFSAGSTNQCDVAGLYTNLLSSVTNGTVTVNPVAPPIITSIATSGISQTSATITWTTDTSANSQVNYGPTTSYGSSMANAAYVTSHSVTLSGLTAGTLYHFDVQSADPSNNLATSPDFSFTTPAALPIISSVLASGITQSSATISWATNVPTNGQVKYGLTAAYGNVSALVDNAVKTTTHTIGISGLSAGTLYHYQAVSMDASGNTASSSDNTFTAQLGPDTTPPTVSITNPAVSGLTVSSTILISSVASDPAVGGQTTSGLQSQNLLVDGAVFASSSAGMLSASLDTTSLTNSTHILVANAKDNAGNNATSSGVSIIVFNLGNATRYPRLLALSSLEGRATIPSGLPLTVSVISPANGVVLQTQTLTPSATGTYTVAFQPAFPQIVNIRAGANGYLYELLTGIDTTVNSAGILSVPQLLAGDFNNDNTVNSLDYSMMNTNWLQNYPVADINNDGIVNSIDFAILKNNYGKSGQ